MLLNEEYFEPFSADRPWLRVIQQQRSTHTCGKSEIKDKFPNAKLKTGKNPVKSPVVLSPCHYLRISSMAMTQLAYFCSVVESALQYPFFGEQIYQMPEPKPPLRTKTSLV